MNNLKKVLVFFVLILAQRSMANKLDSLRIEKKEGKNFVIHRVDKGQTLFGTLRRYGTSLSEYKASNPNAEMNIKIGQVLSIPYNKVIKQVANTKAKPVEATKPATSKIFEDKNRNNADIQEVEVKSIPAKTFKVEPGMTLFAVATRNKTTVANLKKWNNLKSDVIRPGQILIVKEAENVKKVIPKAPVVVAETPISAPVNKAPEKETVVVKRPIEVSPNDTPVVVEKPKIVEKKPVEIPKPDTVFPKPATTTEIIRAVEKNDEETERVVKVEEGIAEIIEVESKSGKYLALHKSAPLGTLVQVKNETNGASVWVKVIGRLPVVDQNENVIIKLSPKAMNRVSPVEKRFRAKINYSL